MAESKITYNPVYYHSTCVRLVNPTNSKINITIDRTPYKYLLIAICSSDGKQINFHNIVPINLVANSLISQSRVYGGTNEEIDVNLSTSETNLTISTNISPNTYYEIFGIK